MIEPITPSGRDVSYRSSRSRQPTDSSQSANFRTVLQTRGSWVCEGLARDVKRDAPAVYATAAPGARWRLWAQPFSSLLVSSATHSTSCSCLVHEHEYEVGTGRSSLRGGGFPRRGPASCSPLTSLPTPHCAAAAARLSGVLAQALIDIAHADRPTDNTLRTHWHFPGVIMA